MFIIDFEIIKIFYIVKKKESTCIFFIIFVNEFRRVWNCWNNCI